MVDIVKKGREIGQLFKNISRTREILSVFGKYGFDELIIRSKLHKFMPEKVLKQRQLPDDLIKADESSDPLDSIGRRMSLAFSELGPSFVKFGQMISGRTDVLPRRFTEHFVSLQDQVRPIPFSEQKERVLEALGSKYNDFKSIEERPIGNASIANVYKAVLKSGEMVVIKIKRPNIERLIETDFSILDYLISKLESVSEEIKTIGLSRVIGDFRNYLRVETNFLLEARNISEFEKIVSRIDSEDILRYPKIFESYTSNEILVLSFLEGVPFNQLEKDAENTQVIDSLLEKGFQLFLHMILVDGFFHADLHGGNLFLTPDEKLGVIDFGLMGRLTGTQKLNLISLLLALGQQNIDQLIVEFLDVADFEKIPNMDSLTKDMKEALMPYLGLSAHETDIAGLTTALVSVFSKHKIYIPHDWMIILRGLSALDGVCRKVDFDVNFFEFAKTDLKDIMTKSFTSDLLKKEGFWLAKESIQSLRSIPRSVKWLLKDLSNNNFSLKFSIDGLIKNIDVFNERLKKVSDSIFATGCLIVGAYLFVEIPSYQWGDAPILSFAFWGLAFTFIFK